MVNHSPFREHITEIVYDLTIRKTYDQIKDKCVLIINHDEYRDEKHLFLPLKKFQEEWSKPDYAYGYLVNPYYTQIVPIDYDNIKLDRVVSIVESLLTHPEIIAADILQSSTNNNYHVYLGLDRPMNVMNLYASGPAISCCWGFCRFISVKHEVIIRASTKFFIRNGKHYWDIQTNIVPKVAYRRELKDTWHVYTANQIIPLLVNKSSLEKEQSKRKKLRIR